MAIAFASRAMDRLHREGVASSWRGLLIDRIAIRECFGGLPLLSWRQVPSVLRAAAQASGWPVASLAPGAEGMCGVLPLIVGDLARPLAPWQVLREIAGLRALSGWRGGRSAADCGRGFGKGDHVT
jgi:hypothetical protein